MKILLIQPFLGGNEIPVFPLGLACLRASLTNHDVRTFDANISERPFCELKELIRNFSPDVIGISIRNIDSTNKRKVVFYYKFLKDTVTAIKSCSPARIIVGGAGFSIYAREIMEDEKRIDFGIYLEGESIFPELLENLRSPEKVSSVYYRKGGEVFLTGPSRSPEIENSKQPDFNILPLEKYKIYRDSIGIETKRGCSLRCIYCVYPFLNGRFYRLKSARSVVDEIEELVKSHGVVRFTFVDSVFNIPKEHSEDICREIVRRKIKANWSAWFSEKYLPLEYLNLIEEAGCDSVILSPDGFTDRVLKKLGKEVTRKEIVRTFRILKKMRSFEVSYNFFVNPPGQSLSNFLSIILFSFFAKLSLWKKIHFEFNSLRIEPHTRLQKIALKEGILDKEDNLLYPKYYTNRRFACLAKLFDCLRS